MFKDFAFFPLPTTGPSPAPDPVDSYVLTSTLVTSGHVGSSWTRPYMTYVPSRDAKYVGVGMHITSPDPVVSGNTHLVGQYFDKWMLEQVPITRTTPHTTYSKAREVQIIIRADRVNLAINPRQITGSSQNITNWTNTNGVTLVGHPLGFTLGTRNGITVAASGSMQTFASVNNFDGLGTTAPVPRRVGLWVYPSRDADVSLSMAGSPETTVTKRVPANTWGWVVTTKYATGRAEVVAQTTAGNAVNGDTLHYAGALAEPTSSNLDSYFDGGLGSDYLYEEGMTSTTGRSFYYENKVERTDAVIRALRDAAPIGIGIGTPRFGVWSG